MDRGDSSNTRTAEPRVTPTGELAREQPSPNDSTSARTEPLADGPMDSAALSFALGRERVLSRLDHSAAVVRLRRALGAGLFVWLGAGALDLFVAEFALEARLQTLFACRAVGSLVVLGVLLRLWRRPEPSVRLLWALDVLAYTTISVCISLNATAYRGLDSPYGAGILVVMLTRGATT